jgi:hypothetical protein
MIRSSGRIRFTVAYLKITFFLRLKIALNGKEMFEGSRRALATW